MDKRDGRVRNDTDGTVKKELSLKIEFQQAKENNIFIIIDWHWNSVWRECEPVYPCDRETYRRYCIMKLDLETADIKLNEQ